MKLKVSTSIKLIQPKSNAGGKKTPPPKVDRSIKNRIVSHVDTLVPVNREVLRISVPIREIAKNPINTDSKMSSVPIEWGKYPMSINVSQTGRFTTAVDIRCHENGNDHANVFVIAFPFNGMINPIPEDPKVRIYKGFISSSIKPFFYNNRKYRKILYLVLEVNKNLFREDHKYHTPVIPITLESYALFDNKETGDKQTSHETMTINITSPKGDHEIKWEYETIPYAVMKNINRGENLWVTYDFTKPDSDDKPRRRMKNRRGTGASRPVIIDGNTMITTNKHGIRKEIPLQSSQYDQNGQPKANKSRQDYNGKNNQRGYQKYNNNSNRGKFRK